MSDDQDTQPCCVALLAGTLTLMTAFADAAGDGRGDAAAQRHAMARKITSNLFFLSQHADLPPGFRTVAARLQARWAERDRAPTQAPPPIDDDRAGAALLH